MEYDRDKVDEVTMGLLYLVIHQQTEYGAYAWKSFDWDTLNRLHEKGLISNPVGKAKSVALSSESVKYARRMFGKHFALDTAGEPKGREADVLPRRQIAREQAVDAHSYRREAQHGARRSRDGRNDSADSRYS